MPRLLSVVIKTLNEEANIGRTLRHAFEAIKGIDAEVIVADSISTDQTVRLSQEFPVKIVQLVNPGERSCGAGGQMGFQHSLGRFILVMDGDMDLQRDFVIAALARLQENEQLAGVGGVIEDVNFANLEYRARKLRAGKEARHGFVDRLYGGGMFRREAIEAVGYYSNRNLHACEELELGLRLVSAGWAMERLPMRAAWHHGHTVPVFTLMARRWRSRYSWGAGELLRTSLGKPYFLNAARAMAHPLVVIAWWMLILCLVIASTQGLPLGYVAVIVALPFCLLIVRKKSIAVAIYSLLAWQVDAAGLIFGMFSPQCDPRIPIETSVISDGNTGAAN